MHAPLCMQVCTSKKHLNELMQSKRQNRRVLLRSNTDWAPPFMHHDHPEEERLRMTRDREKCHKETKQIHEMDADRKPA